MDRTVYIVNFGWVESEAAVRLLHTQMHVLIL
jgi:hypothetical protein